MDLSIGSLSLIFLQDLEELLLGPEDADLEQIQAQPKDIPYLLIRQFLEIAEDDGGPVFIRKLGGNALQEYPVFEL